ncbi:MAG: STAS-like domain-containing protein [Pseudomonadales bacterium]
MSDFTISVVNDFHEKPFGRYRYEGGDSCAEVFREEHLIPAMQKYDHVVVDLSGYDYYGSSFLEETFRGLVRAGFSCEELNQKLKVVHTRLPSIEAEVLGYIKVT